MVFLSLKSSKFDSMRIATIVSLLVLLSCQTPEPQDEPLPAQPPVRLSKDQRSVHSLAKRMEKAVAEAPNELKAVEVQDIFEQRFRSLIKGSGGVLDSMRVTVDELSIEGDILRAVFVDKYAEYYFLNSYRDMKTMRRDSIFQFLSGMKEGDTTTIQLFYLGDVSLHPPRDRPLLISVAPAPLRMTIKDKVGR